VTAVFEVLRRIAPELTMIALAAAAGLLIWQWNDPQDLVAGALRLDDLAIAISLLCIGAAATVVLLSIGEPATDDAGSGEYHALLLSSVLGMVLLSQAQNLITSSSPSRPSRSPSTCSARPI
jgi:NADH-quinone oxidoreductase subunit N